MRSRSQPATLNALDDVLQAHLEWGLNPTSCAVLVSSEATTDLFSAYTHDLARFLMPTPKKTQRLGEEDWAACHARLTQLTADPSALGRARLCEQHQKERTMGIFRAARPEFSPDLLLLAQLDVDALPTALAEAIQRLLAQNRKLCLARVSPLHVIAQAEAFPFPRRFVPSLGPGRREDRSDPGFWVDLLARTVHVLTDDFRQKSLAHPTVQRDWRRV